MVKCVYFTSKLDWSSAVYLCDRRENLSITFSTCWATSLAGGVKIEFDRTLFNTQLNVIQQFDCIGVVRESQPHHGQQPLGDLPGLFRSLGGPGLQSAVNKRLAIVFTANEFDLLGLFQERRLDRQAVLPSSSRYDDDASPLLISSPPSPDLVTSSFHQ